MEKNHTLKALITEWLEIKKISVKISTYYRYVYIIEQYVLPFFGDISMKDLEDFNLNKFVINLQKTQSPTSIKNTMVIFKSILGYASKRYGYRFQLDFVAIPKAHTEELRVLSTKEKNKLEKFCLEKNNLRYLGIIICLNTGLRVGEICGLKWDCIDLERRSIKVTKTIQRVYNKEDKNSMVIIDVPKSQTSIRTIPISTKLYNILKPLKKQYNKNCYFLTGQADSFVEPRVYQKFFKNCVDDCKIKNFHFHQLRHTFATDCINVGMDTKSLSEVLGHSNVKITLDRYVHSSFQAKKKYLEKL